VGPDGSRILCNRWGPPAGVQPGTAAAASRRLTLLNPDRALDLFCSYWSPDGARVVCHSEGFADSAQEGPLQPSGRPTAAGSGA
jgi:hypothetical protein